MSIVVLFLLCFAIFFAFYRLTVRRVLLNKARFTIFALRDEVRDLGIHGKIDPASFAYVQMEKTLSQLIFLAPALNMYQFGQFLIWQRHMQTPARELQFRAVAPQVLLDIEGRAIWTLFRMLLINSPLGAIILSITLPFIRWSDRQEQLQEKGREFLEQELAVIDFAAAA